MRRDQFTRAAITTNDITQMQFLELDTISNPAKSPPTPHNWTAIIPAAGRGSRLGYDKPKILYPIAGRPILDWLIDLLEPHCQELVFVLSPSGEKEVIPHLEKRLKGRYRIAIQAEPKGMADAIYQAVPGLSTPHTLIIWGDQVAIRPRTISALINTHQSIPEAKLTLPIVERETPYVHYQTDAAGNFIAVLERREGATMPEVGQSDCGLFLLDTAALQQLFAAEQAKGVTLSQGTKEWNFLPMLPQLETGPGNVNALSLRTLEETVGVNDQNDVELLERYFRSAAQ